MRWPFTRIMVGGDSMTPTLRPGDYLLVRRTRRVREGQVIVVRHPHRPTLLTVKRAVRRQDTGWWVEGDAAEASTDSRSYGTVGEELIVGRVVARYWPLRDWAGPRLGSRRRAR